MKPCKHRADINSIMCSSATRRPEAFLNDLSPAQLPAHQVLFELIGYQASAQPLRLPNRVVKGCVLRPPVLLLKQLSAVLSTCSGCNSYVVLGALTTHSTTIKICQDQHHGLVQRVQQIEVAQQATAWCKPGASVLKTQMQLVRQAAAYSHSAISLTSGLICSRTLKPETLLVAAAGAGPASGTAGNRRARNRSSASTGQPTDTLPHQDQQHQQQQEEHDTTAAALSAQELFNLLQHVVRGEQCADGQLSKAFTA
jgi:hypothetical protein